MKRKKKQSAIEGTLEDLADLLPEVAQAFATLAQAHPDERSVKALAVSRIEDEADSRHLALVREVGSTFITPYDREDLFELLESLDDIIDEFDLAARVLTALPLHPIPDPLNKTPGHLKDMAILMSQAVHQIKDPEALTETLVEANRHYALVRNAYVGFLMTAFLGGSDPVLALQGKILADHLEVIAAGLEDFGRALGVMAIKET